MINWRQGRILADRYLETMLADWKATGVLVLQAPLLAAMVVAVWGNIGHATGSLYFVMTLSAFWLGCTDACREICKERALFLRERMVNLEVGAYLYSKMRVLALLNVVQVVAYALIIDNWIDVRVPIGWLMINLLFTALCGTALGLLISASVENSDLAVGMVPLVILPQILFSEFAISEDAFAGFSWWMYNVMPAGWAHESLKEFGQTAPDYLLATGYIGPLMGVTLLFLVIAYPILRLASY
ncbi:MAG: ABC transporter permease [Bradymonadaceae bacterium]